MLDPDRRAKKNREYRKRWHSSPEFRERRKLWKREWEQKHPEKKRAYTRRYHLKRTLGYVAGYQRNNARLDRQEAKRAAALKRYYEIHPVRPDVRCRSCKRKIAWSPPGRPPVTCDHCARPSQLSRRKRPFLPVEAVA